MAMETLNSDARYVLCRPRGGFNDQMVQFEFCRRHAARFGRTLIVDFSQGGLRLPFDEVFVPNDGFGCPVITWSAVVAAALDQIESVAPAGQAGRISANASNGHLVLNDVICMQTGELLTFDLKRDHDERLLVHEQYGGGIKSLLVLQRVGLVPALANDIARRLVKLGSDYDAIHVRHTDLNTDYRHLFMRCRALMADRDLLICSDSAEVKAEAASIFKDGTRLLSAASIPEHGGKTLHFTPYASERQMVVDMLSDLLAMARSRRFVFSALRQKRRGQAAFSGFTLLAESLHQHPEIVRGLFAHADADLKRQLFETPRPRRPFSVSRTIAELDSWRWNFAARRASLHCRLKATRDALFGAAYRG